MSEEKSVWDRILDLLGGTSTKQIPGSSEFLAKYSSVEEYVKPIQKEKEKISVVNEITIRGDDKLCPNCSTPAALSQRFCAKCGSTLILTDNSDTTGAGEISDANLERNNQQNLIDTSPAKEEFTHERSIGLKEEKNEPPKTDFLLSNTAFPPEDNSIRLAKERLQQELEELEELNRRKQELLRDITAEKIVLSNQSEGEKEQSNTPSKTKKNTILIAVLFIIIIGLLTTGGYFLYIYNKKQDVATAPAIKDTVVISAAAPASVNPTQKATESTLKDQPDTTKPTAIAKSGKAIVQEAKTGSEHPSPPPSVATKPFQPLNKNTAPLVTDAQIKADLTNKRVCDELVQSPNFNYLIQPKSADNTIFYKILVDFVRQNGQALKFKADIYYSKSGNGYIFSKLVPYPCQYVH